MLIFKPFSYLSLADNIVLFVPYRLLFAPGPAELQEKLGKRITPFFFSCSFSCGLFFFPVTIKGKRNVISHRFDQSLSLIFYLKTPACPF